MSLTTTEHSAEQTNENVKQPMTNVHVLILSGDTLFPPSLFRIIVTVVDYKTAFTVAECFRIIVSDNALVEVNNTAECMARLL